MPLTIVPDAGDVLMCQFDGSPPEMTKLRRVIVLTPRNRAYFPDTFLVVPVSKSRPTRPESRGVFHCGALFWTCSSKMKLQPKLHLARLGCRDNASGVGGVHQVFRKIEVGMIGRVEHFPAELQTGVFTGVETAR